MREVLVAGAEGWGFARLFSGGLFAVLGREDGVSEGFFLLVFWGELLVSGVLEGSLCCFFWGSKRGIFGLVFVIV